MLLKKHPLDEAAIVERFRNGEPISVIARDTDTAAQTIRDALRRNGVDTGANAHVRPPQPSPFDGNEEFFAALGTDTDRAIAARFNTSAQTVCNHRKKRGVKPFGWRQT